jgi:phage-related protein
MYQAVQTAGTNVYNFIKNLPGRIRGALSTLGSILSNVFKAALAAAKTAVSNGANAIYNFFHGLPGRIRSGLGNLGSLLKGSGQSIIDGLLNGIKSAAGRVLDYVSGLANRVKDSFNNALSIFSPSREFFDSGVNIGKGVILGIKDQLRDVASMAKLLASTTIQPTLTLPAAAASVGSALGLISPSAAKLPAAESTDSTFFGPYEMVLDGAVLTSFVVDTITGQPTVVSKASNEGDRVATWRGSGRKAL